MPNRMHPCLRLAKKAIEAKWKRAMNDEHLWIGLDAQRFPVWFVCSYSKSVGSFRCIASSNIIYSDDPCRLCSTLCIYSMIITFYCYDFESFCSILTTFNNHLHFKFTRWFCRIRWINRNFERIPDRVEIKLHSHRPICVSPENPYTHKLTSIWGLLGRE